MKTQTEMAVRSILAMDSEIKPEDIEKALDVLRGKIGSNEEIDHVLRRKEVEEFMQDISYEDRMRKAATLTLIGRRRKVKALHEEMKALDEQRDFDFYGVPREEGLECEEEEDGIIC